MTQDTDKRLIEVIELYKDRVRDMGFMETVPPGHTWSSWTLHQLDNLYLGTIVPLRNPHVQDAREQLVQCPTLAIKDLWDRYLLVAFAWARAKHDDYVDRLLAEQAD